MRTYGQHCSLARSLDLLGERWTLLVVRELALGPARFGEIAQALPGIGTNLLSARLKALEQAEVVARTATGYELGPRGEALMPILEDLAIWGFDLMPETPGDDVVQPRWAALTMAGVLRRSRRPRTDGVYAFEAGEDRFWLRVADDRVDVRRGAPPIAPDATIRSDTGAFFAAALGHEAPLEIEGDARAARRLLKAFRLPTPERRGGSASRGRAA